MDAYQAILQSTLIQSNDDMISKFSDMFDHLCMSPEMAEKTMRLTSGSRKIDDTPSSHILSSMMDMQPTQDHDENDDRRNLFTSTDNGGSGKQTNNSNYNNANDPLFPIECLSMDRWDLKTYVDATSFLTRHWSLDELNVLLQSLALYIDGPVYGALSLTFEEHFFAPKFTRPLTASEPMALKDEWRHRLVKYVYDWDPKSVSGSGGTSGEDSGDSGADGGSDGGSSSGISADQSGGDDDGFGGIRAQSQNSAASDRGAAETRNLQSMKSCVMDYCRGDLSLEVLLGTRPGSTPSASASAIEFLMGPPTPTTKKIMTATAAPTDDEKEGEPNEMVETEVEVEVPILDVALSDAERDYKAFMKIMTGMHGLDAFKKFMKFLKDRIRKDEISTPEAMKRGAMESTEKTQEAADGQAKENTAADNSVARKASIQSIFEICEKEFHTGGHEAISIEIKHLNQFIDDAIKITKESLPTLQVVLESLKFDEGAVGTEGKVSKDQFVNWISEKTAPVSDIVFEEVISVLTDTFALGCASIVNAQKETTNKPVSDEPASPSSSKPLSQLDRLALQKKALEEIRQLSHKSTNFNTTISQVADTSLNILRNTLELSHPSHHVRGRISIAEQALTHIPDSPQSAGSPDELNSPGVVEKFLRFVAVTDDLKASLWGTTVSPTTGFEGQVMATNQVVKVEDGANDPVSPISRDDPASPLKSPGAVARFVGVPFVGTSEEKKAVGVLGLTMTGEEDGGFDDLDVKFLEVSMPLPVIISLQGSFIYPIEP
jgi:hypothetical protein